MMKSRWIWNEKAVGNDTYVEFFTVFTCLSSDEIVLKLSFDGFADVTFNGKPIFFSACGDYPDYKYMDEIKLSGVKNGRNKIVFKVWHHGTPAFTYHPATAGLFFEIYKNGELFVVSNKDVPSRVMRKYFNGQCKEMNFALGLSFSYDNTKREGKFIQSCEVDKSYEFHPRRIKNLTLSKKLATKIEMRENSAIIDMGFETSGFLHLDFISERNQKINISYGEYLTPEGNVNANPTNWLDFNFTFIAKKGRNQYENRFRRLGGRYIQVAWESPIEINYIGIKEVNYPSILIDRKIENKKDREIYDLCVRSLQLCMHEHYEDCPWREQGLYAFDSRNQMLFGYYAFKTYEFQRANLVLLSKSVGENGLLTITAISPKKSARNDGGIPFFSLAFIMAVSEYVEHSGDKTLIDEVGTVVEGIFSLFNSMKDNTGLIVNFDKPTWNFFEWGRYRAGGDENNPKRNRKYHNLILNCMYLLAKEKYARISGKTFNDEAEEMKRALKDMFYVKETGLYQHTTKFKKRYCQLANALVVLCGLEGKEYAKNLVKSKRLSKATLAMKPFVYDALLEADKEYADFILKDIRKIFGKMLKVGATSTWETEDGVKAFGGVGSLCHAWAAFAPYYYTILGIAK